MPEFRSSQVRQAQTKMLSDKLNVQLKEYDLGYNDGYANRFNHDLADSLDYLLGWDTAKQDWRYEQCD